ncbi:MAG: protein tyrosine phosphatase family protein [Porticoccus sp.]|nr:protein tyrosine phosphatase family protein [Porticoccus sp.]
MKRNNLFVENSLIAFAAFMFCAQLIAGDANIIAGIKNLKTPGPSYFSGGQPTDEQLMALAGAGVKHVINLRLASETPKLDEASLVADRGMIYHSLPVDGAAGLTLNNVKVLDQLFKQAGEEKVFLHCASGNRVGALVALRAALIYGDNTDAAIAQGKVWGLTGLEPELRRLMGAL